MFWTPKAKHLSWLSFPRSCVGTPQLTLQRCVSPANNAGALSDEFPRRSVGTIKHLSFRGFRVFRGQSLKANSNRTNRS